MCYCMGWCDLPGYFKNSPLPLQRFSVAANAWRQRCRPVSKIYHINFVIKMYHKVIYTFIFLFIAGAGAFAQTYIITGRVSDLQSHQFLSGVTIQATDGTGSTVTDNNGVFHLKTDRPSGLLRLSATGYKPQEVKYRKGQDMNIQMEVDVKVLNEVRVTAYGDGRSVKQTAGGIALITGVQMRQGDGTSMQQAMNSVPGVRMDHSHGEDSKISIRGEGVRSPWGNRSIKIYVNDIPLTETDGTSRLEALDVSDLGRAEIIKGPASSLYGGGVGGVIKFQLERAPYQEESVEAAAMFGEYGLNRQTLTYRNGGEKLNSYVSIGRQQTDGYRQHSSDERNFIAGNFQWFPSSNRTITLLVSRTIQNALIPGPLTATQMKEDPRQAPAEYIDKNASREHKWTRVGIGQKYIFNNHLSNSSSVFTYFYDLHHPLPFGIINSTYQSFGGRTRFDYNPDFEDLPTTFTIGGEFTQTFNMGNIYYNEHGIENGLMSNTDYHNKGYSVFYQSETELGRLANLVFGISLNGLTYRALDRLHPAQSGVKNFNAQVSPRVAISHDFGEWLTLHGTISSGFTNPASDQIQNPDRSINKGIQAEKGINYEIDAKGNLFNGRFGYDLALFIMDMKGELIGQSLPFGVNVFHNTGRTKHQGAELGLSYQLLRDSDNRFINSLFLHTALTASHFRFIDYKVLDENGHVAATYDGNPLTGIAPWMFNGNINLETRVGFYANANLFFNDHYTMNDAATDYNPAYTVINAKVGYQKKLSTRFGINVYAGMQNIGNESYSSFTEINTPGYGGEPAYFNPALPRNTYAGMSLKYFMNHDK